MVKTLSVFIKNAIVSEKSQSGMSQRKEAGGGQMRRAWINYIHINYSESDMNREWRRMLWTRI
ncbi:MAG: hypothetical protein BWY28_00914 [bacterium ADurb.Bin236]|nr:MAG: hypothetical protein BWY28_00914 [bacterium ADurb.Bin236]